MILSLLPLCTPISLIPWMRLFSLLPLSTAFCYPFHRPGSFLGVPAHYFLPLLSPAFPLLSPSFSCFPLVSLSFLRFPMNSSAFPRFLRFPLLSSAGESMLSPDFLCSPLPSPDFLCFPLLSPAFPLLYPAFTLLSLAFSCLSMLSFFLSVLYLPLLLLNFLPFLYRTTFTFASWNYFWPFLNFLVSLLLLSLPPSHCFFLFLPVLSLSAQKVFSPSLLLIFSLSPQAFSPPQTAQSPLSLSLFLLSFPAYHCFSTLTHCCLFLSLPLNFSLPIPLRLYRYPFNVFLSFSLSFLPSIRLLCLLSFFYSSPLSWLLSTVSKYIFLCSSLFLYS